MQKNKLKKEGTAKQTKKEELTSKASARMPVNNTATQKQPQKKMSTNPHLAVLSLEKSKSAIIDLPEQAKVSATQTMHNQTEYQDPVTVKDSFLQAAVEKQSLNEIATQNQWMSSVANSIKNKSPNSNSRHSFLADKPFMLKQIPKNDAELQNPNDDSKTQSMISIRQTNENFEDYQDIDEKSIAEPNIKLRQQVYIQSDKEETKNLQHLYRSQLQSELSTHTKIETQSYKNHYLKDFTTFNNRKDKEQLLQSDDMIERNNQETHSQDKNTISRRSLQIDFKKKSMKLNQEDVTFDSIYNLTSPNMQQVAIDLDINEPQEQLLTEINNQNQKLMKKNVNQQQTKSPMRLNKVDVALKEKEKLKEVNKTEIKKGSSSLAFNTLYSMRKGDSIHTASVNTFQLNKKQDFQTANKSTVPSKEVNATETSKTPGKVKKYNPQSQKKVIQQAQQPPNRVLNQSLTGFKSNAFQNPLVNKTISNATPSQKPANIRRVGIHQQEISVEPRIPQESRQMVSSPGKQRPPGRNKEDYKIQNKKSLTIMGEQRSKQQQEDLALKSRKTDFFNSKSPSKKSVQLQHFTKAIQVDPDKGSKKSLGRKEGAEYLNQNNQASTNNNSQVRVTQNNSIIGSHSHTKSFQALQGNKMFEFSHNQYLQNLMPTIVNKHQNPYIHQRNKQANQQEEIVAEKVPDNGNEPRQSSSHIDSSEEAKPKLRTQTSLNNRLDAKSVLSMSNQIKSKGSGLVLKHPLPTRNNKNPNVLTNGKNMNSPHSVQSIKVPNTIMTDRSERSALAKKHDRLTALLLEKKQNINDSVHHQSNLLLSERKSNSQVNQETFGKNEVAYSKDKEKYSNKYLFMGKNFANLDQTVAGAKRDHKSERTNESAEKMQNRLSDKKVETKYMEISFNHEGKESVLLQKTNQAADILIKPTEDHYKPISPLIDSKKMTPNQGVQEVNQSEDKDDSKVEAENIRKVLKKEENKTQAVVGSGLYIGLGTSITEESYKELPDTIFVKTDKDEQSLVSPVQEENDDSIFIKFPMSPESFLKHFKEVMLEEELEDFHKSKYSKIYYAGLLGERLPEDMQVLREQMDTRIQMFMDKKEEMTDNNNGEFQGHPMFDNFEGYYRVSVGDHICYRYEIVRVLGKGSFAQVVECRDHSTRNKDLFAVKITRNTEMDHKFAHKEAQYLKYIMHEDPNDKHNIVRMLDQCYFRDHQCFVFELLHTDLFEHLKATGFVGFSTDKIRDYAIQLLNGLVFLEKHKIIHCDLKPENILCADTMCRNLKIVDFGSGCFRDEQIYTYVQSRFYRSPEVILRIKYSEKVDIWSLGCILAELYTGEPIFPGNNEQEQLEMIMELCGIPPNSMVDKSRKKDYYFDTDYSPFLIEDENLGILRIPGSRPLKEAVPCEDNMFLDFIQKCLEINPETRFSASEAIEHPWVKSALQDKLLKTKDPRLMDKKKPAKRMGQNESLEKMEKLFQPQIIRDRDNREREVDGATAIPLEFSPGRDVIVGRKKPNPGKESFGLKISNFNLKPKDQSVGSSKNSSFITKKMSEPIVSTEVKISDYIAEFQKSQKDNSPLKQENKKKSLDTIEDKGVIQNSILNKNIMVNNYTDDTNMVSPAMQYFNTLCKQEVNKHKSILPEIDFTNKYVRKQQPNTSVVSKTNQSNASPENSQLNQSVVEATTHNNLAAQSQQPLQQSPFRNKFTNQSNNNYLNLQGGVATNEAAQQEQQTAGVQAPNPQQKKKNSKNTVFLLPSQ